MDHCKTRYEGPIENGWYQGKGKFFFASGVIYDGEFDKGEFQGKGTLVYPNGVSALDNDDRENTKRSGSVA